MTEIEIMGLIYDSQLWKDEPGERADGTGLTPLVCDCGSTRFGVAQDDLLRSWHVCERCSKVGIHHEG